MKAVMAERQQQIEFKEHAALLEKQAEQLEVQRTKRAFMEATQRDVDKEQKRRAAEAKHWLSVDKLKQQRAEDASNAKQEIRNWDQKFAMNSAVYDHAVGGL